VEIFWYSHITQSLFSKSAAKKIRCEKDFAWWK